jgi:hypothetical protein
VKDEQMLILWLVVAVFFGFMAWKLMQEKDVMLTLAFTEKKEPMAPALNVHGPNHHGFLPV